MRYVKQAREGAEEDRGQAVIDRETSRSATDQGIEGIALLVLFACCAAEHTDTEEKGLMQDQHQDRRNEEGTVSAGRCEEGGFGIRCVLNERPGEVLIDTHVLVAVNLDIAHGLEHNIIAGEVDRLHVEERRHIAVERYMGLSERVSELACKITREIDDTMHLLVAQQLFGFGHGGAGIGQFDVWSRIPSMQELAALSTIGEINHSNRYVGNLFIPIDGFVYKRVREGCDDEDHRHARIAKNAE